MDTLFGKDVSEHRKQKVLLTAGMVSVIAFTVGMLFFVWRYVDEQKRTKAATLLSLVKKEQSLDIELATRLALEVEKQVPSSQSYEILKECCDQLPDHVADLDDSDRPLTGLFSKEGKRFAAGFSDGTVKVWETHRWKRVFKGKHHAQVSVLACNEDGTLLASSDNQGLTCVWNVKARTPLWKSVHVQPVIAMDFTPDGSRLLVLHGGSADKKSGFWSGRVLDVLNGRPLMEFSCSQPFVGGFFISGGKSVVTGSTDGSVQVRNAISGKLLNTLLPPGGEAVDAISAIVPGGKREYFSAITWSKVHLWKSEDLSELFQTSLSSSHVSVSVEERPESIILAVGCADGMVRMFSWRQAYPDRGFTGTCEKLPFNTIKVAINPVRDYFAAGSDHGIVKLWEHVGMPQFRARVSTGSPTNTSVLSFDPTGEYLVSGTEYGSLQVVKGWKSLRYETIAHKEKISAFVFHPLKPWVITVAESADIDTRKLSRSEVVLWDYSRNPALALDTVIHNSIVRDISINRDGTRYATAGGKRVSLWSIPDGSSLMVISVPEEVYSLAFARQDDQLAVAMAGNKVQVYESRSGKLKEQLSLPEQVSRIEFSGGDRYLGVLCSDGPVHIYDRRDRNVSARMISGFDGRKHVYTMAFHPAQDLLAIGTGKDVFLCDIETGQKKGRLLAGDLILNMAMSSDGKLLLTENSDERRGIPESVPTLFDLASKELAFTIPGLQLHTAPQFSYDNQYIGAIGAIGSVVSNTSVHVRSSRDPCRGFKAPLRLSPDRGHSGISCWQASDAP